MRYTLLELVQQILGTSDGDEVNSINDTAEAEIAAKIVKETYYDIVGGQNLPEHWEFFELEATSSTTPTLMYLPDNVISLEWIKYNNIVTGETDNQFKEVCHQDVTSFLDMQEALNTDEDWVSSFNLLIGTATINFKYRTDRFPLWYTSWDDHYLLFDAIDTGEDANLQKSKTWCYGRIAPVFTLSDTYIPDLDQLQFQLLLNKSRLAFNLWERQTADAESASRVRDNKINLMRNKQGIPSATYEYSRYRGFGRIGPTGYSRIPQRLRNGS